MSLVKKIKNAPKKIKWLMNKALRKNFSNIDKKLWDDEYNKGGWEFLKDPNELERIYVAKKMLRKYPADKKIFEIGCGEGIFFLEMDKDDYSYFEGMDISEVAINRIPATPNSYFTFADMEVYEPKKAPFDVIVLNEVLYFSKDPNSLLLRYTKYLKNSGVYLIGMYSGDPRSAGVWANISKSFIDVEIEPVSDGKKEWIYKTVKLKS